jgi:hypothetical protein
MRSSAVTAGKLCPSFLTIIILEKDAYKAGDLLVHETILARYDC